MDLNYIEMRAYCHFIENGVFISPVPKDRGMLWFYVKAARRPPPAARRPQWC